VVASNGELLGIVTVDDTLEELLPASWRRKRGLRR
jgi:Mg2+/Co2+ transporter CorB